MRRLEAKSGASATSSRPPWPVANTAGTPASGADTAPSAPMRRMRPGRSVTRNPPCGSSATDHGCTRPLAMVVTRTSPSRLDTTCVEGFGASAAAEALGAWQPSIGRSRTGRAMPSTRRRSCFPGGWLAIARGLQFKELCITSTLRDQFGMRAAGFQPAFVEYQDPVRHPHAAEAMRDQYRGAVVRQFLEALEHLEFAARVQRGGRFVEDHHLRVAHVRACDRDLLPLSPGKVHAGLEAAAAE